MFDEFSTRGDVHTELIYSTLRIFVIPKMENSVGSWRGSHDLPNQPKQIVDILAPMVGQPAEMQKSLTVDEAEVQQSGHRTHLNDQIPHELGGRSVILQLVLGLARRGANREPAVVFKH
jgi:hypothetical protein